MFTHVHLGTYMGMTPPRPVQTCSLCGQYIGQQVSSWHSSEMPSCYQLPMKLQEGNVFSYVCPSFCPLEGAHVTMIHVTIGQSRCPMGVPSSYNDPSPPRPRHFPFNIQGSPAPAPSQKKFKLVQLGPHHTGTPLPFPDMLKLVHYVAWTASKRAIGIRLKCLLVVRSFYKRFLDATGQIQALGLFLTERRSAT